jgi:peroxiredoxin
MPALESKVWKAHRDKGLVLVAVGREHSAEEVAAFKAQNQLSFPLLADKDRGIYSKYAVKLIPRCYLIGRDGTVKFATVGFSGERDEKFPLLLQAIEQELAR